MPVDTDVVLWSLRALPNPENRALRADEVARFIAKDATLSDHYSVGDVALALDSLVDEGLVVSESTDAATLYRVTTLSDVYDGALAELASSWVEADDHLKIRAELEIERDALGAERDTWRRRAEDAEQDVLRANSEADQLRARIRALESSLDRERALSNEKSEVTRRAAIALEHAHDELEQLRTTRSEAGNEEPPPRRSLRGNWLR